MESEVAKWLSPVFKDLTEVSFEAEGTSSKGDGYLGDILFGTVKGIAKNKSQQQIDVVLKCSKRSDQLRQKMPVQRAFLNEIAVYDSVFPVFRQFELARGIKDPFNSVPKYYGKFVTQQTEVIVLENLKKYNYDLWDRKLPLPREYLRTILQEYAKFHAISVAMQDQQPEVFKQLPGKLEDVFQLITKVTNLNKLFRKNTDEICDLLQGVLDDSILQEWREFKNHSERAINAPSESTLKVITHADCWSNNFLFQSSQKNGLRPKVYVIDWQISHAASPVLDLSYFLFCTISKEDIVTLNELLEEYFQVFANRLELLGTNPRIYSKEAFFKDWTNYSCYGLMMSNMVIKLCLSENEELPDIMDLVNQNLDLAESFSHSIANKDAYKDRMAYIIEYAVKQGLVKNI